MRPFESAERCTGDARCVAGAAAQMATCHISHKDEELYRLRRTWLFRSSASADCRQGQREAGLVMVSWRAWLSARDRRRARRVRNLTRNPRPTVCRDPPHLEWVRHNLGDDRQTYRLHQARNSLHCYRSRHCKTPLFILVPPLWASTGHHVRWGQVVHRQRLEGASQTNQSQIAHVNLVSHWDRWIV